MSKTRRNQKNERTERQMTLDLSKIKVRRTWGKTCPAQSPHITKNGKKGYDRREGKKICQDWN